MIPTVLINLALGAGTAVLTSIMAITALWLNGSSVIGGHLFFDTTNNSYPSEYVNSGAYATRAGVDRVLGGGVRITASGSDTLSAYWQVPSVYASGAMLERVSFECNTIGRAVTGSLVIDQPTTRLGPTVGTTVRNFIRLATGSTVTVNTGALLNTKITDSYYISFIGAVSGAVALPASTDCVMKPLIHEKYGR